jgi:NitT/TauT family transport system substrate-binding protein
MTFKLATAFAALVAGMAPAAAQDLTEINVLTPLPRHTAWYPLLVGEALGYFAEEGISVNLVNGGDLPSTAFLENGQVDIASLDPGEVILAQERGFDFDVIYEVMHGAVEGIFVLADNPAETLEDLRGTNIGIVGESDRAVILAALGHAGLTEADVTITVMGESAPLLANSLSTGQISGVVGAISDFVAIRSQGIEVKNLLPEAMGRTPPNNFAVRSDIIGGDRDEVLEGFLRAWAKSGYAGLVDIEVTQAISQAGDPENWVNPELGALFLEGAVSLHTPEGEVFGGLRTDVWTNVITELTNVGLVTIEVAPEAILNPVFLDAANDFDRAEVEAEVAAWRDANM